MEMYTVSVITFANERYFLIFILELVIREF